MVALKLDISKAYNIAEWNLLRTVMTRLGFSSKWVELVLRCISIASFSMLINGKSSYNFIP